MTPFGSICSRALGVQMLKKATSSIKDASMSLVGFFVCLIVFCFFLSLLFCSHRNPISWLSFSLERIHARTAVSFISYTRTLAIYLEMNA